MWPICSPIYLMFILFLIVRCVYVCVTESGVCECACACGEIKNARLSQQKGVGNYNSSSLAQPRHSAYYVSVSSSSCPALPSHIFVF